MKTSNSIHTTRDLYESAKKSKSDFIDRLDKCTESD